MTKKLALKPTNIVYQESNAYYCFDLENLVVTSTIVSEATILVRNIKTLYVIDGDDSHYLMPDCITLYISSPRSDNYKTFVTQYQAIEWYFPV